MKVIVAIFFLLISTRTFSQGNADTSYSTTTRELKSSVFPALIFKMQNLKHIRINGEDCDYKDASECWAIYLIPREIKNLQQLESLELPQNAIKYFPKEISELKNLKEIDLTDNNLVNIDVLTTLTNLEELYLYGCNLHTLPKDIYKLKKLKKLGLTGNNLDAGELEKINEAIPSCEIIYK